MTATEGAKNDIQIISKWSKFNKNVEKLIADTNEIFPYHEIKDFVDVSEDLMLNSFKKSGLYSKIFGNTENKES